VPFLRNGLVAEYLFDSPTGLTIVDNSGYGGFGTITGAGAWVATAAGPAWDNTGGQIEMGTVDQLTPQGNRPFTMEFYFIDDVSSSSYRCLWGLVNAAQDEYINLYPREVGYRTIDTYWFSSGGNRVIYAGDSTAHLYEVGIPCHAIWTYDGSGTYSLSTVGFYINGVATVNTVIGPAGSCTTVTPASIQLCNINGFSEAFDGKLLLFRKWTRVLSQGEAVQLYQLAQIKEKPMYTLVRGPLRKHKKVLSLPGVGTLRRRPL
jgi:hypothetical protein